MSQVEVRDRIKSNPSQPTMSRVFSSLVASGILTKSGETKGAKFALSDLTSYFAVPPQLRQPVPYDAGRINDYVPNQTRWLPAAASARFEQAARGAMHQLDVSA